MSKLENIYNVIPSEMLMKVMPMYGSLLNMAGSSEMGQKVIETVHRMAGKTGAGLAKITGVTENRDAVELTREFLDKFFADITEYEDDDNELVFSFSECPYGFCSDEQGELCRATMNLEEEAIAQLGGELYIEERIAEGAERCKFRVTNSF